MVAPVEQIHQEIKALMTKTGSIAQDAHRLYREYLAALGRSVARQLILASYHLCTQAYPKAFLELSLDQRQTLQQKLQHLGHQLDNNLQDVLQPLVEFNAHQEVDPNDLFNVLEQVDQSIRDMFRHGSEEANQLLQDHNILDNTSINTLFDIAAKAEEAGRSVTSTPHLLKALVETKETKEEEDSVPVVAIYLQVADVEFTDTDVMNRRHQLRQLWQQLTSLEQKFDQKQQEKMVAEAMAAWRASWIPYESD